MKPTQLAQASLLISYIKKAEFNFDIDSKKVDPSSADKGSHFHVGGSLLGLMLPMLLAGGAGGAIGVANNNDEDVRRGRGAGSRFLRGGLMGGAAAIGGGAGALLGGGAGAVADPDGITPILGAGVGLGAGTLGGAALMRKLIGN